MLTSVVEESRHMVNSLSGVDESKRFEDYCLKRIKYFSTSFNNLRGNLHFVMVPSIITGNCVESAEN